MRQLALAKLTRLGCLFVANGRLHLGDEVGRNRVHAVLRARVVRALFQNFPFSFASCFKITIHANVSAFNYLGHIAPPLGLNDPAGQW